MEDRNHTFNDPAIQIIKLTKYYGDIKGIENVSLEVTPGIIHGFLGPNGAGKTTTIRILVGLLKKTSGDGFIFGTPIDTIESKHLIGYLPSDFELYKHYTVNEYLDYIETLRGIAPLRNELVERMKVDTTRKTAELSRGNKQKIAIVQALMHEPRLLIADEPTTGLDPLMQEEFNNILKEFVSNGNTAFISSHLLAEVQDVCDRVSIIKDGHIVSSGEVDDLLQNLPRKAILKLDENVDTESLTTQLNVTIGQMIHDKLTIYFDYSPLELLKKLQDQAGIIDFTFPEPDLEEYFLSFYKE
ncbi:MAG: ABC transporter ATP-binding protein [Candidatus Kariarchaeaceae archaeon]|jgi:ABC-2 type transport system ATP-binding protein